MEEAHLLDDVATPSKPSVPKVAFSEDEAPQKDGGHFLHVSADEAQYLNFKILVAATERPTSSVIQEDQPFDLLFFRRMFSRLKGQLRIKGDADEDGQIPITAFQRAMNRLLYVLQDPDDFDARKYVEDGRSCVDWNDLAQVWKDRQLTVKLSLPERIFFTMDDPQSSTLAKFVSAFTLLTIVISSLGFILSTVPDLQDRYDDGKAPEPKPIFEVVENVCLVIFVIEYCIRLGSCPTVRTEIYDRDILLDVATGFEVIKRPRAIERLIWFILSPSNVIDAAAILPGVVSGLVFLITSEPMGNGGGFVILRLVRLTRIFRAFRLGKYVEPVMVLMTTVKQSTKALYVLAFNLLLGVVIFGSLMFLMEPGTWDKTMQAYTRKVGKHWNSTLNDFVDDWEVSPWKSIPQSFWWATVTAAQVGYGDNSNYPSTTDGKIVGALCMVWSLVLLSLPVGVIGGTFDRVWHEFAIKKRRDADLFRREMTHVASALQRVEPDKVSRLVLLDVWSDDGSDDQRMPRNPDGFMGSVRLELDISQGESISRELKLPMKPNFSICKREVSGFIYVKYDWEPRKDDDPPQAGWKNEGSVDGTFLLNGNLRFEILGATGLINIDWSHPTAKSSPYVLMLCYPSSPAPGVPLSPMMWRSSIDPNCLNPNWNCRQEFNYLWYLHDTSSLSGCSHFTKRFLAPIESEDSTTPQAAAAGMRRSSRQRSPLEGPNGAKLVGAIAQLTAHLPKVTAGIEKLTEEVYTLSRRVDYLQYSAANLPEGDVLKEPPVEFRAVD